MQTTESENEFKAIRLKNDVNGNSRYAVHFLAFLTPHDHAECEKEADELTKAGQITFGVNLKYTRALQRARQVGGRKFHNKQFGGGIVFQCYGQSEIDALIKQAKAIQL